MKDNLHLANDAIFAESINKKIKEEAGVVFAKAVARSMVGVGFIFLSSCIAFGIISTSVRSTMSVTEELKFISQVIVDTVKQTNFSIIVVGEMQLQSAPLRINPQSEIRLRNDSAVRVDPNSPLNIVGNIRLDTPRPTPEQLKTNATSKSGIEAATEYVVFRSTPFRSGMTVETNWTFKMDNQRVPASQYCYLINFQSGGRRVAAAIALDGFPAREPGLGNLGIQMEEVFPLCQWF